MPKRNGRGQGNDLLITRQIYHLYNRSIDGKTIFPNEETYTYFVHLLDHCKKFTTPFSQHAELVKRYGEEKFRMVEPNRNSGGLQTSVGLQKPIPVKLHAYTPMPNHFHLLVEQTTDNGIAEYIGRVCNSFTKALNEKLGRRGVLWQGRFKARLISDNSSYLQIIRYIHINPARSSKVKIKKLEEYPFSSYLDAIGKRNKTICDHSFLRELIPSPKEYEEFVLAEITDSDYKLLEELILEAPFSD